MILTLAKDDPRLKLFREDIFAEDLELPIECMDMSKTQLAQYTNNIEQLESAWKMSNTVWDKLNVDQVWYIPNVSVSCGYKYDTNRYRGAYLTYTRVSKRKIHRSLNFKEFGFFALQSIRAAELGCSEIFLSVYEYDRKMSANIRALKHKGYGDAAGNILHQELEYKGVELVKSVDQHIFSIDFKKLWEKYDEDLMEMKNDEAGKVNAKYPNEPKKYPDILELKCKLDYKKLYDEYLKFNDNENYILSRRKDFKISPSINMIISSYLGFTSSVYNGVALNKKRTSELKDNIGEYTRQFLQQFPTACRINYITTKKNWKTKQHIDHADYSKQGFRIIVPFDEMKMTFDNNREYILKPGKVYFVNVCIPHVGEHYSDKEERAGLLFKLLDDGDLW